MAELTLKERLRKAALTVETGKRSAIASAMAGPLKRWTEPKTPVDHMLIVPQDLRTADPSFWDELEHDQFGLAGSIVLLRGRSPFEIDAPNATWARELHGFGWLRNLAAVDTDEARDTGRRLALEWTIRFGNERHGLPAEPAVAARRLISWLSHANLLLEDADRDTYGAITASLGRQYAQLSGSWREAPAGYPRLLALVALAFAALSLAGHDRQLRDIEANLAAELGWQVLPRRRTRDAQSGAAGGAAARPAAAQPMLYGARSQPAGPVGGSDRAHAADAALFAPRRRHAGAIQRRIGRSRGRPCHRHRL
ncbi:MAG: hypothetical protein M5U16_05140 [Hyphomicrobium sp.]|nr:hypothetical protein [Hyphomicrobium sp.]